jgi:hypothetical protein
MWETDMSWKNYERAAEKGPWPLFWILLALLIPMLAILSFISSTAGWIGEAQKVARQEFGPSAMLKKYEWFKDAAAQLDKKRADIRVYEQRLKEPVTADRLDREQRNLWLTELAGVKASYNGLAAEYNAQMAKFNWSFANAGQLPQGASDPLPREYKPYTN